jgi:hypothetical protein
MRDSKAPARSIRWSMFWLTSGSFNLDAG